MYVIMVLDGSEFVEYKLPGEFSRKEHAEGAKKLQLQLAGEVPVRLTYLRDAYLALARLKKARSDRPPGPYSPT